MRADDGSMQRPYCVAVVGYDAPATLPGWVKGVFEERRIEFAASNCTTEQEVVDLAQNADVILTSSARSLLTARVMDCLTDCRGLVRVGSGVDCIDITAATSRRIIVANTPGALAGDVAERAVALMLAVLHRTPSQDQLVKSGRWTSRTIAINQRIRRKTLGLVGFGRIALALAEQVSGFEMTCIACDPYVSPAAASALGVRLLDLDELLCEADIVSLHIPLSEATRHLIGARELRLMKREAVLINTARGAIIDPRALYQALSEGWIAGASLDVMDPEPPAGDDPLLCLPNVVLTPHSAAFSYETLDAMYRAGCDAALAILDGALPESVVNAGCRPWWLPGANSVHH